MRYWELTSSYDSRLISLVLLQSNDNEYAQMIDLVLSLTNPVSRLDKWYPIDVDTLIFDPANNKTDIFWGHFLKFYSFFTIDNAVIPVLRSLIASQVEFLPITYSVRKISIIHVTNAVTCLDHERSEFSYFKNRKTGVRRYIFEKECLKNQHIFVLPEESYLRVYVSDEFKNLVEANSLEGLRFMDAKFEII